MADPAPADPIDTSAPPSGYLGGLGLITLEGPTGMFLNPTSGIMPAGALTLQSCMTFKDNNGEHIEGNGVLLVYGLTNWLEVGTFGLFVHDLPEAVLGTSHLEAGQINARARLMRDEGGMPEVSIGGLVQRGDNALEHESIYVAASKGYSFGEAGFVNGVRLHTGFRQTWQELGDDISTGFFGLELALPRNLFIVGEINTRDDSDIETPYSVGMQYRGNGFGMSLALVQAGGDSDPSAYVGIGVSY